METKHKYIIRNENENDSLLIFLDVPDSKNFIKNVMQAFTEINFELTETNDMFISDELTIKAISDIGAFTILRDNEDYYSVLGKHDGINRLDSILYNHPNFKKTA